MTVGSFIAAAIVATVAVVIILGIRSANREYAELRKQLDEIYARFLAARDSAMTEAANANAANAMPTRSEMERERNKLAARLSCHNRQCLGFGKHP